MLERREYSCALEVVGDRGEVDLGGSFGEISPSHPTKAVTALPGSKDLLDPATHAMDRLIPFMELAQDFLFVAAPHAGGDDPGETAFRADSVPEMIAAIGTIGKNLTGIVGQGFRTGLGVIDIGGCDRDFLDQPRIAIGADMGLEAMNSPLSLVFHPARIVIVLTRGGDDGGINQGSGLDCHRLGFELHSHGFKQCSIQLVRYEQPAKPDEGGTLGRGFIRGKPAEAAKGRSIVERLGQLHIGQIVPDRYQQRLEHRQWRPGRLTLGSRIKRIEQHPDRAPISDTSASSDEADRSRRAKPNCS